MSKIINEYANSMFNHEIITDLWIKNCTDYLISIFADSIKDKIILDYAFGRGNWSLAFLKANAKKVIAIDASIDNVKRFQAYVDRHKINNIEVIHGNFLEHCDYNLTIDIFWIYGILQHIEDDSIFLNILKKISTPNSLFYIYAYPINSIRYFLVENSRKILIYKNNREYLQNSPAFIHEANMRIRDDLTAPYIKWYSKKALQDLLEENGLYVQKSDNDFYHFLNNSINIEFQPLQFQCTSDINKKIELQDDENEYSNEFLILQKMIDSISNFLNKKNRKFKENFIIGFNNTYYSAIHHNNLDYIIEKLFIYLAHFMIVQNVFFKKDEMLCIYLELLDKSIKNLQREEYKELIGVNVITNLLINKKIRL